MDYNALHLLLRYGREHAHRKIREKGFTDTEHMICSYVFVHEGCSQDMIAKGLGMDKTTIGKALDALEARSLIRREQSQKDKRKNLMHLTDAGRESISGILRINEEWMNRVLSVLTPEEQTAFMGYFDRILSAAGKMLGQGEDVNDE